MAERRLLSRKIAYTYFVLVGFLFVFCCKTCGDLARNGNILWTGGYVAGVVALSLILGGALGTVVCFGLYKVAFGRGRDCGTSAEAAQRSAMTEQPGQAAEGSEERGVKEKEVSSRRTWVSKFLDIKDRTFFGLSFCANMLSFLPSYLAFYPAICAYDTIYQLDQAVKNYLIEHHPLVHTLLLKGIFNFGNDVLGSANAGIAIYAAMQVVLLSLAFACGLTALHHYGVKWYWQLLGIIYCLCYPFHHYLGVSITKDTVFGAFFLIAMVFAFCVLQEGKNQLKPGWKDCLLFFSIVGIVLFRNNGKYALLVLVFFLVLTLIWGKKDRKLWGRLTLVVGLGLVVGQVILTCVFNFSGAQQGDKREMLSMPIQQLARTMIYHGGVGVLEEDDNTMEEADKALVNDFLLNESYQYYNPILSDPVKTHTNTYVVRYRTMEFAKTYLSLLAQYPGDFINAGLAVNAGYLYPGDVTHTKVYEREGAVGEGYVAVIEMEDTLAEWGIYKDSKWPWLYENMVKWADENAYLNIPVLKYLFVPGVYLWLYLVLAGYLLICRKFRFLLPLSLVLGYFATLILGPTVQLRYIYPLMITLPFLAMLSCRTGKEN